MPEFGQTESGGFLIFLRIDAFWVSYGFRMGPEQLLPVVQYRCVCGNALALISSAPRECLRCGRSVPIEAFDAGNVTIIGDLTQPQAEPAGPDPLLNARLKHFRILSRLGQGGMGAVYRAVDESLERYVALKVIRHRDSEDSEPQQLQRLLHEARAQARICHPNVTQVYYVDHEDNVPFLAMELIQGETLEERLRGEPLTFPEIVDIALQTCRALEAASRYHVVHGDIKPGNLLLAADGTVKLSDFGLARPLEELGPASTGISGTPNYLSPEACQGQATDFRSDMYSLGVVLYEMTFGQLPYRMSAENLTGRLHAHIQCEVEFPEPWPQHLPVAWKELLSRLLAKNREARFADYAELLDELGRLAPARLPLAGRTARLLAWTIDLALLLCLLQIVRDVSTGMDQHWAGAYIRLAGVQLSVLMLLAASLAKSLHGTSLGKELLQIRTVDEHGLKLGPSRIFVRTVMKQLPLWGLVALRGLAAVGLSSLGWAAALVLCSASLVNAVFALVRPDGRSFHDLLCRSRVVLDTTISGERSPRASAGPDLACRVQSLLRKRERQQSRYTAAC